MNEVFSAIRFVVFCGGNYLIWTKIDSLVLKIILCIIFSIVVLSINRKSNYNVPDSNCPFLNDLRLLQEHGNQNPEIWYNTNFCSVSDYGCQYENINGITRPVSNTNKFYSCCVNEGRNCPIFEKYNKLSSDELLEYYRKRNLSI
jgi:hypothetical protein